MDWIRNLGFVISGFHTFKLSNKHWGLLKCFLMIVKVLHEKKEKKKSVKLT